MIDYFIENDDLDGLKDFFIDGGITQEDLDLGLLMAAIKNKHEIVKELLARNARINIQIDHYPPVLHCTIRHLNRFVAKELILSGADVDLQDDTGWTPLHYAIDSEVDCAVQTDTSIDYSLIEFLLEKGANPSITDAEGITPIQLMKKLEEMYSSQTHLKFKKIFN